MSFLFYFILSLKKTDHVLKYFKVLIMHKPMTFFFFFFFLSLFLRILLRSDTATESGGKGIRQYSIFMQSPQSGCPLCTLRYIYLHNFHWKIIGSHLRFQTFVPYASFSHPPGQLSCTRLSFPVFPVIHCTFSSASLSLSLFQERLAFPHEQST